MLIFELRHLGLGVWKSSETFEAKEMDRFHHEEHSINDPSIVFFNALVA